MIRLALVFALALSVTAQAQTYSVPTKLPIERVVKRTFPEYFKRSRPYYSMVPETFFPIGWSQDGKFAYYVEPVDEACGCYYANLVIIDLVTDKVLWEFKYNQDDTLRAGGDKMAPEDNIQKLWAKNRKLFSEKLAEHGIIASSFAPPTKTFTSGGDRFIAKAAARMGQNVDGGEERVNLYTVSLISPRLGTKKVFTSEDHTKDDYWFMLRADVLGVLKSPYEKRVAIIAMEVMRGYEGPPHTGGIRIVGADLHSGFSRK